MTEDWPINLWIPVAVKPKQSFNYSRNRPYPKAIAATNANQLACEIRIRILNSRHWNEGPYFVKGPIQISLNFCWKWLDRHTKKERALRFLPRDTSPDWDNLSKQVSDILEKKCSLMKNDGQISHADIRTWWTERTGVWIRMREDTECLLQSAEYERLSQAWSRSDAATAERNN